MGLDINNIELRDEEERNKACLCQHMATSGRKQLLSDNGFDPEEDKTSALTDSHPESSEDIHIFEGYHLQGFIYHHLPNKTDSDKTLLRFIDTFKYGDRFIYDFPSTSGNSVAQGSVEKLFSNLAVFLETSEFQILLSFFVFCYHRHLPLRIFDSNRDTLKNTIDEMQTYKAFYLKLEKEGKTADEIQVLYKESNPKKSDISPLQTRGFEIVNEGDSYAIKIGEPDNQLHTPEAVAVTAEDSFSLLDWQQSFIPLSGRENELEELHAWLDNLTLNRSILLVHGSGGVGKTRLAFHFAKEAKEKGWEAGRTNSKNFIGSWKVGEQGLLLIIDYVEDRYQSIKMLLRAVENFDACDTAKIKLRILVLSRNSDYANRLTKDAKRRVRALHLAPLNNTNDAWEIFDNSWKKLSALKRNPCKDDATIIQPDKGEFSLWHEKESAHKNPLFIIALAIYLHGKTKVGSLIDIGRGELTRYLTEREARLIQNEVEEYNRLSCNSDELDYESILLLKAVSTLSSGLDARKLSMLKTYLDGKSIYPIPDIKHLTRLSLWSENEIQPLEPDILAADFLEYCLSNWAANDKALWITPPIFEKI